MSDHINDNDPVEKPSKSQDKQEAQDLQKIGEILVDLPESQLMTLPLPSILLDAIMHARSVTRHEAKRRQLQYIGKIMRKIDAEPIKIALKKMQTRHASATESFHEVEEWRETLIAKGDDAISTFLDTHPEADRQQLRQLVRKAQFDRKQEKKSGGELALFKYIRELLKA